MDHKPKIFWFRTSWMGKDGDAAEDLSSLRGSQRMSVMLVWNFMLKTALHTSNGSLSLS